MRSLLTAACIACVAASCADSAPFDRDGWATVRRFDGASPSVLSISEINAGSAPARGAIQSVPIRSRERGRLRISLAAEAGIASTWTSGAALFDPQLDRALDWLGLLDSRSAPGPADAPAVELRLTLMPGQGARREQRSHPSASGVVIDLLVPVATHPRSRSAAIDEALATGLHEAAHVLRGAARDRDDDEYRASLVASCFRLEGSQRGDRIALAVAPGPAPREFTRARSADAALAVQHDLAAVLGKPGMVGGDLDSIGLLHGFCIQRLARPPR